MDLEDRTVPELRDLADEYARDHGWPAIEALPETTRNEQTFTAEAWARKAVAEDDLPGRLDFLQAQARDADGRVRERVEAWEDRTAFLELP